MTGWQEVLIEPARLILAQVGQFVIKVLGVLLILLIGWLISKLVRAVVSKGLKALKVDLIADRIELSGLLEKGGISVTLSELIGNICYWIGLLVSFMVAIDAAGLTVAASLLNKVLLYIPNVVGAIFILILGLFAATLLRNIVLATANNAGISQAKFLGKATEVIFIAFSIFIALEQLKIGIRITQLTISIVLGSIGLALALAFGLGCRDLAEKAASDFLDKIKSNKK